MCENFWYIFCFCLFAVPLFLLWIGGVFWLIIKVYRSIFNHLRRSN